ncbi:MAG: hypothetical protein AMJ95_01220 [Omnitrophica WOR_2 bacterium SM23_72]|nr:MAG: hypothetical protein AMJ95_01220 [Omnitrophica WOR_2 bacterium SM23_72]
MSDITLINISIAQNIGEKVVYKHNSVGVFLLVAMLEQAGFQVNFREHFLDFHCSYPEEIKRLLSLIEISSSIIGIGCHLVHLPFVVMASRELKKQFPDKKIILGGIGPSSVSKELIEKFDFIDAVVLGEAEETIVEVMLRKNAGFNDIAGVVYRENDRVVVNNARPHIEDLSKIPLPAYHAVDFKQLYEIPTVITSRGCPFECAFCSLSLFDGKRPRYNSIDNVIKELRVLVQNYGTKYLFFVDPTFTINKTRTLQLCRRIREENLGIRWFCMTRVECMSEELMDEMGHSGCETIFYGIDTGSDKVLKRIKRGYDLKQALDVVRNSVNYFQRVEVGLMWGFPFETLDDFEATVRLRHYLEEELRCGVQLRWLEPYPATALMSEYKDDLFLPEKYSLIFKPEIAYKVVTKGKDYYEDGKTSCINIPDDVTSVRYIVAATHTASMCRQIIEENPHIFSDFYRYRTPDLDKKISIVQKFSVY